MKEGGATPRIEDKLKELGHELPSPPSPLANYIPGYRTGNLVFLSGVGPRSTDGSMSTGKLGREFTVEQGYAAARTCALNLLANLKSVIGDLDGVVHIVKVLGMVNCEPEFGQQPQVINGCSDLFVEYFGKEKGVHARSALGVYVLPNNIPVEIETILELNSH